MRIFEHVFIDLSNTNNVQTYKVIKNPIIYIEKKEDISDSLLRQHPIYQRKTEKDRVTTQKRQQIPRLHNDGEQTLIRRAFE